MIELPLLFENNRKWASHMSEIDPSFFLKQAQHQNTEILWIGCSDSRVNANEIIGLLPGELFVHRNVANLVVHTDMNCFSVLQYAVDIQKIKHIIICGHYECRGVTAATESRHHGFIDNWLLPVSDLYRRQFRELSRFSSVEERMDRLCELNVMEQVKNVGNTTIVQEAWNRGQTLTVHGWIYTNSEGLLKDMNTNVSSVAEVRELECIW